MSLFGFRASKIWIFFEKIYCGASLEIHFQAEIIPEKLLFFDFVFMVWENLDSWELD